ncbi:MAG: dihydropteroate synthase [Prevotellaceae bacterium]|jgi:dihydropteroate synthase|nr:dihydropteroate synthase [Prevotellaceae bacterium]
MRRNIKTVKFNNSLHVFDFPIVMGILNVTPDSFYSTSRNVSEIEILHSAEKILTEGANIIDIGGFSTRPNAEMVHQDEEIRRVCVAIELILKRFPTTVISVDTFRAGVAEVVCRNYNVRIINDVGGGMWDERMFETIARTHAAYILMHTSPAMCSMTVPCEYDNIAAEVISFFNNRIKKLNELNINDIILDFGFGFAKNTEQNYDLFSKIKYFDVFDLPLLVGISRKSMLQRLLGVDSGGALNGTSSLNTLALVQGADILRVHDVHEAVEAVKIYKKVESFN